MEGWAMTVYALTWCALFIRVNDYSKLSNNTDQQITQQQLTTCISVSISLSLFLRYGAGYTEQAQNVNCDRRNTTRIYPGKLVNTSTRNMYIKVRSWNVLWQFQQRRRSSPEACSPIHKYRSNWKQSRSHDSHMTQNTRRALYFLKLSCTSAY